MVDSNRLASLSSANYQQTATATAATSFSSSTPGSSINNGSAIKKESGGKAGSPDNLFRFIIVGNASSGKTCLLHYYIEGKPKLNSTYTIGVEFGSKDEIIGEKRVKVQLWDTAGQDRFRSVSRTYYRGAIGAVVAFDLTNQESFDQIPSWVNDVRELANKEVCIIVCGNKLDLADDRIVSNQEAKSLCETLGVSYIETSAMTGENVEEAFQIITKQILTKIDNKEMEPVFQPRLFIGSRMDSFDQDKPGKYKTCQC